MKRYLGFLALAALPPMTTAASTFQHVPGAACISGYGADDTTLRGPNLLLWGQYGHNVSCPIPILSTSINPITVNPALGRVDYMDSNTATGGAGDVSCQLQIVTNNNTSVTTAWVYACATPGGCATNGTNFTGYGYISFADTIASTANVVGMSVTCRLPGYDPVTFAPSGIVGVGASTTTP